jgi:hypothetical protein
MPPSADRIISILIGPQDESAVPTLFARLSAAGNQAVRISQPDAAVMESGFVGNVQPTSEISDSRQIAFRHRVPCDGLGRLAEDPDPPREQQVLQPNLRIQRQQLQPGWPGTKKSVCESSKKGVPVPGAARWMLTPRRTGPPDNQGLFSRPISWRSSNDFGPVPLAGSIRIGHWVLLKGTSGGSEGFSPRAAISFSRAARPPKPSNS